MTPFPSKMAPSAITDLLFSGMLAQQTTMKAQTDHFRVSGVRSTLPADFPEISLRLKLLFICAASAFAFGLNSPAHALEPHWTSSHANVRTWSK
jgi:hypothetical protein